ncbi:glycosyl hydrolase family 18 protein [Anaerocolumna sp. MB42-C2]|uniref:glycosyl hydrolase family 18 protein n=1 Tax=Anaerocolumna sp. MB42-C2 TaxID=3070997 RepID=UPI0027E1A663|nr:glycosyl hydrolase family 18 protein [Anaerocolumna sp. MB42-C2]WMJ85672.1 glycosyl hydrolase family 18 protein [Anaerocolumna sp. MB42-C2]
MDRRTKQTIIGTSIALVIIIVIIGAAMIKKITPSDKVMDLSEYYKLDQNEVMVIMQNQIYEKKAYLQDKTIYLDFDTINGILNKRFYWDSNENILSYTTPTEIIKTEADSSSYYINEKKKKSDYPIAVLKDNAVYVAIDFVKQYSDMSYEYYKDPNRIVIKYQYGDYLATKVKKATQLRYEPSIKSDILVQLEPDQSLTYVDPNEVLKSGFSKVMTADGIIGYVKNNRVEKSYYDTLKSDYKAPEYTHIKKEGDINLVWHQVTNRDANNNLSNLIAKTQGVTTVSPTWFKISDNEGSITSLADENYVKQAHTLGLEVWGLVDDFSTEISMTDILSHTSSREKLIQNLINAAKQYKLDGLNIDFEKISSESGNDYIELIRELSVMCRNNGIVLSIDNYVPTSYTAYYDREEQGLVADYVIIMAYDEHHGGSEESGSVASIGFVDNAINNILKMVPGERVIIGIPFYTRMWKETPDQSGNITVTSQAYGMSKAKALLEDSGASAKWDDQTGQYYGEYEKDGATYKIWLEEEDSIETKLKLINKANVAGIACWKLGLEKENIWDVINKYLN